MGKRLSRLLWGALFFAAWTFPAAARGDKYIPQVADGAGRIRTKIDIHNLSPSLAISKAKLFFFRQDGSPWVLATNLGAADHQLAVSVFYEVLDAMRVVDTVSVPIGEPCLRWVMPVETDVDRGLLSG